MEEKLKNIIRKSKWVFLDYSEHNFYDTFKAICLLSTKNNKSREFSLEVICQVTNSENPVEFKPCVISHDSFPITVDEYKCFMSNCSKKYLGQFEPFIHPVVNLINGILHTPTIQDIERIIDFAISEENMCYFLVEGGFGFCIIDRTL